MAPVPVLHRQRCAVAGLPESASNLNFAAQHRMPIKMSISYEPNYQ
jgi:hypothetical protein